MLSRSDPGLIDVIKNSRHSVEGLREVARRIDAIEPGLYRDLRKLDIGSDDEQTDVKAMLFRIAKIV